MNDNYSFHRWHWGLVTMKMVPAVPRLQKFYNTCATFKHKFNIFNKFHISKSFYPPSCWQLVWSQSTLHSSLLPTLSPNTKHSHTCYCRIAHKWCTADIVFSSILFTKRKAYSICFKCRNFKPIDCDSEPFKGIPLIYFFLQHSSTMKSNYKNYFYLNGSVLECKNSRWFQHWKNPHSKYGFIFGTTISQLRCV